MIKNNYYSIAENDLKYIEEVALNSCYYNQTTVQCQQAGEKFLKYIVETYCINADKENVIDCLKTHNIRKLIRFIQEQIPSFTIDSKQATLLQGYYFETRYPGDNFFTATKEDVDTCYEALRVIEKAVYSFMVSQNDPLIAKS